MKIVGLQAENFKRLRAISIHPNGDPLVRIVGKNAQGKTSALDCISAALGGERLCPDEPIRRGAETADIQIDLGDLVVRRRFTAAGSSLEVKSKEGAKFPSPQSMLDRLVGKISFDPLSFTRAEAKVQVETLRKLVGLDFTLLDRERKEFYEERTIIGRDVAVLKGAVAKMPEVKDAPDALVSVAALLGEQEKLLASKAKNDEARRKLTEATRCQDQVKTEHAAARREVERLEALLAQARAKESKLAQAVGEAELETTAISLEVGRLVDPDLAAIRQQLAEAEGINARVRAKKQRDTEVAKLATKEEAIKTLGEKIDALDQRKAAALSSAQFPIAGLSFTDDGVTLNGLGLSQASAAEQLRVSLAVGIALNPKLKVLLIRDGSLLDEDSLRMVSEMAEKADAQVWIELVGTSGEGGVLIEDGMVDGVMPAPVDSGAAEVIY
jgi:ABC-type cobalamin/Fe3+-siderophores transport system ATPase subunit